MTVRGADISGVINGVHALVVTYRRPETLESTLLALRDQTLRPETLTVVDNGSDKHVERMMRHVPASLYVDAGDNLGPAGGLAVGVERLLDRVDDSDWIMFVDDDDPPVFPDTVERLVDFRDDLLTRVDCVGGVGVSGGGYDRRRGRPRRFSDAELDHDAVSVDFFGGNQFPLYSVKALRCAGGPQPSLFFGFDDLELGLRLQRSGFGLWASGPFWLTHRQWFDRMALTDREAAAARRQSDWRRYYGARNLCWIARIYARPTSSVRIGVRSLAAGLRDGVRHRSAMTTWSSVRGVRDGWRGRLGRTTTVE